MMIYDDFWRYDGKGPYKHKSTTYLGPLLVKLIGYESDAWLGEGMWGDSWGNKGYFTVNFGDYQIDKFAYHCTPVP